MASQAPNTIAPSEEVGVQGTVDLPMSNAEPKLNKAQDTIESTPIEGSADEVYPKRVPFAIVYTGLLLATFVIGFDANCVATIIPVITDEFHSLKDVGWYGTAYLIASASTIIVYGKTYKYFPAKRIYLAALAVYLVGSVVCATATSSLAFIIGRAIAGLGSAGLVAGAKVLISRMLPLHRRPVYQGFIGAAESFAIAIGPVLGGAITVASSWRAVFYISIPIAFLNGISLLLFGKMPDSPNNEHTTWQQKLRALDLPSIALFIPSVVCLVLALSWAGSQYEWSNFRIIMPLTMSGVLALAFGALQYRHQNSATLPPRIIMQRSILSCSLFAFCNAGALYTLAYYLPIYFQAIKGANTLDSGLMTLPFVCGLVIASIGAGYLTSWIGYYTPSMIASTILTSVGTGLTSTLGIHSRMGSWITFQILFGLGEGLGFQQPYVAAQRVVVKADIPISLVAVGFAQRLGTIVCLAVAQNIYSSRLLAHLQRGAPQVNPGVVLNTGATNLRTSVPAAEQGHVLLAYSKTIDEVFYISVALACIAVIGAVGTEWKSVKQSKASESGDASVDATVDGRAGAREGKDG